MTITPSWNKEDVGNGPGSLPSPGQPHNLSDLDTTEPSMRLVSPGLPGQSNVNSPSTAGATPQVSRPQNRSQQEDSLVGTVFAERYEVLEMLGRGGMGSVYKARNLINKNLRALKLMHAHLVADPQVFRRFQQEATAAARINHPNAITIIDMGMAADGRPYLIMDFLDGISLAELLKYKKKLPILEAIHIFIQMCGALTEAHSQGVIHRDIKPSNVMILDGPNSEYKVKVVDFGIAKVFPQEGDPTMKDTTTGELFGSPPYMSPEQCLGKRLDYRSDIYSMGCLMYEVLTGAPPLVGQNALGTMYRQINDMPTPLTDIKDDVRLIQRLDEIITKSLQKDPENRYQTITDLQRDLESATELSAKKVAAFSAIKMKLQAVQRVILNSMGSNKRLVVGFSVFGILVIAAGALIVAPYALTKDPSGQERAIAWQPLQVADNKKDADFDRKEKQFRLTVGLVSSDTKVDPDLLAASSRLASLYMNNDKIDKAFQQFTNALMLGHFLLVSPLKPADAPNVLHNIATVSIDRILCRTAFNSGAASFEKPINARELGSEVKNFFDNRDWSIEVDKQALEQLKALGTFAGDDAANLCAAIGLELIRPRADHDAAMPSPNASAAGAGVGASDEQQKARAFQASEYFQQAMKYLQTSGINEKNAERLAPILSLIGDHFRDSEDPADRVLAKQAYELAAKAWLTLGERGRTNLAVVEDRLGRIEQALGNKQAATDYFAKAVASFEAASHADTLDGAKALFDEADVRWSAGDFAGSIKTHNEAARVWAAKRSST